MADDAKPPGDSPDASEVDTVLGKKAAASEITTILGGKYELRRMVGQGAFGRVYLAYDPLLHRNVAVKELLAARDATDREKYERYLDRFQREARAAGGMEHANIVTVHELAVDVDRNYYLVMQFVDGTDLRALIAKEGSFSVEQTLKIALEVARALDAVHEADIVHRDLKPANIMITRRGVTKLTDFGIAQVGDESQRTQISASHPGTPLYMSPEQANGTGYLDGRSDLYSLGVIIYEMLTGKPYARKREPLVDLRPDLSPQVVRIIETLIQKDPDARYQTAADLIEDLQKLSFMPQPIAVTSGEGVSVSGDDSTRIADGSRGSRAMTAAAGADAQPTREKEQVATAVRQTRWRSLPVLMGGGLLVAVILAVGLFTFVSRDGVGPTPTIVPVDDTVYTVADAKNLIAFSYPKVWNTGGVSLERGDIVDGFTSVNPPGFIAVSKDAVTPSTTLDAYTDDGIALVGRSHPDWKPGATPRANVKLAGQDARYVEFIDPHGGTPWAVYSVSTLRDNLMWNLVFTTPQDQLDAFKAQADKLLHSFAFCPPSGCVQKNTAPTAIVGKTIPFTDPNSIVTLQYPDGWTRQQNSGATNVLLLTGPDGVIFAANVVPITTSSAADLVASFRSALTKDTKTAFTFGTPADVTIGGEKGKVLNYTYVPADQPGTTPRAAALWAVRHGASVISFSGDVIGAHRADIEGIVSSVTLKPLTTFADPGKSVTMQYPQTWKLSRATGTDPTTVLTLDGPDGMTFSLNVYDPQRRATAAESKQMIVDAHKQSGQYTDFDFPDVPVGGDTAKQVYSLYAPETRVDRAWIVYRGGKEFVVTCANLGKALDRKEPEELISTVSFTIPGTFRDPAAPITLQYTAGWGAQTPPDGSTIVQLNGPDGVQFMAQIINAKFYVQDPGINGTLDDALNAIAAFDAKNTTAIYTYSPTITDAKVAGEAARSRTFTGVPRSAPNLPPQNGAVWILDHNGMRYFFWSSNVGTHGADIDAIVASIAFTK